jgi:hypothetical protein
VRSIMIAPQQWFVKLNFAPDMTGLYAIFNAWVSPVLLIIIILSIA